MANALINPEMLTWARNRSRFSTAALAKRLNITEEKLYQWESGDRNITFIQAQKFATATAIPFGFLFLPNPPTESLPIPDLRTVKGQHHKDPSPELRDIVHQVIKKQAWYKDYLISQDARKLGFVGSHSLKSSVSSVVKSIRDTLNISRPQTGSWETYQRNLIQSAENTGILVMRSGIVASNTRRKLKVSEFRGFAISDNIAPVVFINSSDAPTARLFTLIHELAHIWIGSSGISDIASQHAKEESFCNAVAGEFLVPKTEFLKLWKKEDTFLANISKLTKDFHVSKLVLAKRALDCNLIDRDTYNNFYKSETDAFKNKKEGGGNFYTTATAKNSHLLSRAVVAEAFSGRLLLRDASGLLNIAPNKLKDFARRLDQ